MSTHFFSGGTMPSVDLPFYFQKDLKLETQWWVSGSIMLRLVRFALPPSCNIALGC